MPTKTKGAVCLIHESGSVQLISIDTTCGVTQIAQHVCECCNTPVADIVVETEDAITSAVIRHAINEQLQHGH